MDQRRFRRNIPAIDRVESNTASRVDERKTEDITCVRVWRDKFATVLFLRPRSRDGLESSTVRVRVYERIFFYFPDKEV